jgi:hypothetical protein
MYPVLFDALYVKICDDGVVRNKAIYLALGVLRWHARRGGSMDEAERGREVLAARGQ